MSWRGCIALRVAAVAVAAAPLKPCGRALHPRAVVPHGGTGVAAACDRTPQSACRLQTVSSTPRPHASPSPHACFGEPFFFLRPATNRSPAAAPLVQMGRWWPPSRLGTHSHTERRIRAAAVCLFRGGKVAARGGLFARPRHSHVARHRVRAQAGMGQRRGLSASRQPSVAGRLLFTCAGHSNRLQ